jgi:hypothetical protein
MDTETGREVLRATFRSAEQLQKLLPLLKSRCSADEYRKYALAVAAVVAEGGQQLINRVIAEHPELEAEVDSAANAGRQY